MMKRNIFILFLCLVIGYTWVSAQVTLRDSVEIDVFHGKMLPDSFTNLKGTNVQSNHKLSVTPSTLVIPKTGNLIVSYQHADLLSMVWRMHPEETLNLYFVDRDSMVSDTLKDRFDFSFDYRVYYAGNNCAPIWSSGDYIDYDYYFYTGKPQQWDLGPVKEGEFVQLSYTAEADTCDYSTYERGRALKPFYNCHFYTCYDSLGQITGWDVKFLPGSIWWLNTWRWERLTFHVGVESSETEICFLDSQQAETDSLQISLWDHAYDHSGSVSDHFISKDSRRFYVQVQDKEKILSRTKKIPYMSKSRLILV
ncbi:MAG: hypothetical protein U5R06_13555 [candidate division KSB1 bacterium]|nr:hypothetical protein [candidate division KSB1 bacterium]